MRVGKHAVRRYKQRVGGRTSSRERIVKQIKDEIDRHTMHRYMTSTHHVYIHTRKFIAVCYHDTVITILPLEPPSRQGDDELVL